MALQLDHVLKRFGQTAAVDGVDAAVGSGSVFVVLGPSGCGKTTLLRLIAGLEVLDGGSIEIDGQVAAADGLHVAPEDRNVGVVFQSYALWPHMSVSENVAFPLRSAGRARNGYDARVREILDVVELGEFADRRPADLSGGQRQRVALARCLAQEAGLVLMDEPLANLDPHLREAMEIELSRFHQRTGATIFYITHDQREAMALADQIAVMQSGRFLQVASPEEIYRMPASEPVARFIGRSAIVTGRLQGGQFSAGPLHIPADRPDAGQAVQAVIRPEDVGLGQGTPARVARVTYRGGAWEASLKVEGIDAEIPALSHSSLAVDEPVPITINHGWILP